MEVHPLLGRSIRGGSWEDQSVSTYHEVNRSVQEQRWDDATELAHYFITEADVCYKLFRQWIGDLRAFLGRLGVKADDLADSEAEIIALLNLPDGSPWDHSVVWAVLERQVTDFSAASQDHDTETALALVEAFVETWRRCHDRDVDHIAGLMNQVVSRFGENAIGPMYNDILLPWFTTRYSEFDVDKHPWEEALRVNMMVAFEAMRGHLSGPGRHGDIEIEELPDRYVMRFDPCGSGGRSIRGDQTEGTPPRMESPYNWPVTKEPAPWNHGKPGVCVYCTHCIVLTEIMTIDAYGYPVRAVDPPRYGETDESGQPAKCSWTMFKDPSAVPEEYYTRVGRSKPDQIGSDACGGVPRPTGTGMQVAAGSDDLEIPDP